MEEKGDNVIFGDWLDIQFSKNVMDCNLSEKGIEQCLEASKHAEKIDFKEVWVSPLRRTLDTAYHIFKSHPNFAQIKFIVEPLIREKIMIGSDIPSFNSKQMILKEYKDLFPNLDLSKLDGFEGTED